MHYNLAGIAYLRKFLANIELLANQSNFPKPVIIHSIAICKYICSNIFFEQRSKVTKRSLDVEVNPEK